MVLLSVEGLTVHYMTERGVLRAVDGVTFSLDRGETIGIVGESGCGKTSLGLALIRLLPENVHTICGKVTLDGLELLEMTQERFNKYVRWRRISMVFQGAMNSFNPVLRVGFQVAEPLMQAGGADRRAAEAEVARLFRLVGLPEDVMGRYPHELSGGMKQRAMLAMSLILRPDIVILDEPTSALDVSIQTQIMNLLKRLKRELGISMIFITHDITLSSDLCEKIAVMYAGEFVEVGSADDVLTNPLHPYTQKLLAATPRLRGGGRLEFIPGAPPDMVSPPKGCRFHPRCQYAFNKCSVESPVGVVRGGVRVRCWLHG
ncbi:MAG: ABC transporter ATP-binding protein [Nitrososphaerota archaeon]